jgi:ABC-type transport system involved in multi-copper enzyme maturation permease subunit
MMLWFKAWRESRVRFLASGAALAIICASFVFLHGEVSHDMSDEPLTYPGYIWHITYKGYLRDLYLFITIFLGLGGLTRERELRTIGFTLALPVSRSRLLVARSAVGVVEVALLATLPAILLPALSPLAGQAYPPSQAWGFAVLWAAVGTLTYAMGLLASVLFGGEFTAPVAACFGLLGYSLLADMSVAKRYLPDIHDVMSGLDMPYFIERTATLIGPLPWTTLLSIALATAALVAVGVAVTNRQDL